MSSLFNWDLSSFLVTLLVLITSMPVHECAHAWMAHKLGDDTAYHMGRLDLNPLKHLDPVGSIMLLVTQRFGWAKPVPVNPRNFNRKVTMRGGMALTSLAGPVSNFILAFIVLLLYKIIVLVVVIAGIDVGNVFSVIRSILITMVSINVSLGVFNLLPIPPLDGYNIVSYFIPAKWEYKIAQYQQYIYYGLLALLFFTNIFNAPIGFLSDLIFNLLQFLTGFMDLLIGIMG